MQEDVGLAVGHRRRVPPHVVAHGLHLPARRHLEGRRRSIDGARSTTSEGDIEFTPAGAARRRAARRLREHDLRRRLRVPAATRRRRRRPKLTIPSPSMVHYRGGTRGDRPRRSTPTSTSSGPTSRPPTPRRCGASASSAARYLQLDDTSLAYLNDPEQREHVAAIGGDAEHQHDELHRADQRGARRPARRA